MISKAKTFYDEGSHKFEIEYHDMSQKQPSLRRITLRFSQTEGALWSLMVGSFETFFMYYIVKREVSSHELALLASVPNLLGSLANWIVPQATPNRYLKPALLGSVALQILGILVLIASLSATQPFDLLFISLSLYWMGGMASSPLWIDWISGWLPPGRFGRFLSRRNGFNAFIIVITYLGIALLLFRSHSTELFLYPFIFAALARLVSLIMLAAQPTPSSPRRNRESHSNFVSIWQSKPIIYVIIFTTLFRLVSNIATPFLVPYMMNELHFNLMQYAWLIAVPFIGRSIMFSRWGEAMRSHSPLIVLQICMLLSSFVLLGWTQIRSPLLLTFAEVVSGIAWGGFELACVLLMQSFRPGRARALIGLTLALQNLAAIGGALIGSYFLTNGMDSHDIIWLSTVGRFFAAFLFLGFSFRIHPPRLHLKQIQDCLVTVYRQFRWEP